MSRTGEELERALQAAERRAAELQAWADASDTEAEQLRARVAELEAKPAATKEDSRVAELQAWVDSSEAEADKLRARVAELEAKPAGRKEDSRVAELQAWVDSSEAEADKLRARVAELEAKPAGGKEDSRVAELQAWVDSSEAEADQLRARVAELESKPAAAKEDPRVAELQAWVDSSEAEADQLRARVAELESKPAAAKEDPRVAELQAWVDSSEAEADKLRARVTELESKPAAAKEDPRVAELQAWVDSSEAEADKLRARVTELESKPAAAKEDPRVAELQAWVDSAEEETGQLRARIAELEAKPKEDPRVAELQAWVDSAEEETGQLRARIAELEAKPKEDHRVAELQAWVDSAEEETGQLRARIAELEAKPKEDHRVAELQAWVDSAEEEADQFRARIAELEAAVPVEKPVDARVTEMQAWVDAAEAETAEARAELVRVKERLNLLGGSVGEGTQLVTENRTLVERVSELESLNHSLRGLNTELASRVQSAATRDIQRLTAQLEDARRGGTANQVTELEEALSTAQESVATLEVQREAAVDQVRRYVEGDAETARNELRALETKHRAETVANERKIAALQGSLAEKTDAAAVLEVRLKAHQSSEQKLEEEVGTLRERACTAEQSLGALQSELEVLRDDKGTLEARSQDLARKLDETQRWLAQGEIDAAALDKQLEAVKTERAVLMASQAAAPANGDAPPAPRVLPPPPPADAAETEGDGLEGFSPERMHRLEVLLAAEQVKNGLLQRFAETAEASIRRMQDELEAAGGRLADLRKRLGLSDAETGETLDRLDAARRELHALFSELAHAREAPGAQAEAELLDPEDVLDAPLAALEELANQQAGAAQEAVQALAGEQRAREQLVSDLTWLKAELEKLSNVREDLRHRIGAMVQRELRRKQVVSALLDKLRSTEVAAAARSGTLRRLHAAMELAQRTAVRVQTVYFQKQIGSLQRQLETALGRRPAPKLVRY